MFVVTIFCLKATDNKNLNNFFSFLKGIKAGCKNWLCQGQRGWWGCAVLAAAWCCSLVVLLSRLAYLQQYPALSCMMMVPHPQNCGRYLYDTPRASREDTWKPVVVPAYRWSVVQTPGRCSWKAKIYRICLGDLLVWVCCELSWPNADWEVALRSCARTDPHRGCPRLGVQN